MNIKAVIVILLISVAPLCCGESGFRVDLETESSRTPDILAYSWTRADSLCSGELLVLKGVSGSELDRVVTGSLGGVQSYVRRLFSGRVTKDLLGTKIKEILLRAFRPNGSDRLLDSDLIAAAALDPARHALLEQIAQRQEVKIVGEYWRISFVVCTSFGELYLYRFSGTVANFSVEEYSCLSLLGAGQDLQSASRVQLEYALGRCAEAN